MESSRKPNRRTIQTQFTLDPELNEKLNSFSSQVGRPKSWVVRDALRMYIESTEQTLAKSI